MAVRYVANNGDNAATGLDESAPKLTVQGAVAASTAGDTVMVHSGTYDERVSAMKPGVHVKGYGPTRPVMDSNYTKTEAFHSHTVKNATIENFEIKRYTYNGIYIGGQKGVSNNNRILDNEIHHINSAATYQHGILISYGNVLIRGNTIHHIGRGSEARGIMTQYCHDHVVDGNTIYFVRKDGARNYFSRGGTITNNRVFACWSGLPQIESIGSLVANNLAYDCCQGLNAKHTSSDAVTTYWGVEPAWTRFWHNTSLRCSWGNFVVGPNAPIASMLDVRNNILGEGWAGVWDSPAGRDTQFILDYNLYGGSRYVNHRGYNWVALGKTLAQVQGLGFEDNGREGLPDFNDPEHHDYDCSETGEGLDSAWGTQMGARLGPGPGVWTRYPLTAISSNEPDPTRNANRVRVTDGGVFSYFHSTISSDVSIVFDLGEARLINHIIEDRLTHGAKENIKGFRFEAGDSPTGPWTTIKEGANLDSMGASPRFELEPVTTRYLRWTGLSSFYPEGTGTIILNDLIVGDLSFNPPPPPAPVYSQADLDQARSDGHSAGFAEGRAEGYDEGHRQGRTDMLSDVRAALDAIVPSAA